MKTMGNGNDGKWKRREMKTTGNENDGKWKRKKK